MYLVKELPTEERPTVLDTKFALKKVTIPEWHLAFVVGGRGVLVTFVSFPSPLEACCPVVRVYTDGQTAVSTDSRVCIPHQRIEGSSVGRSVLRVLPRSSGALWAL